jgi:hypothetical protein
MYGNPRRRALGIAVTTAVATTIVWGAAAAPAGAIGAPEAAGKLAYIDPGSGSFILQALVAALAGVAVAISAYWTRIKQILGIGASKPDDEAAVPKPSDD